MAALLSKEKKEQLLVRNGLQCMQSYVRENIQDHVYLIFGCFVIKYCQHWMHFCSPCMQAKGFENCNIS